MQSLGKPAPRVQMSTTMLDKDQATSSNTLMKKQSFFKPNLGIKTKPKSSLFSKKGSASNFSPSY